MRTWCFLVFSAGLIIITSTSITTGPFDVFLTNLAHCPEPSNGIEYAHKVLRITRKKLILTGNVSIVIPFNDELDISLNLAKQTNQGWKDNFFVVELPNACSATKQYLRALDHDLATQMKLKSGHCPYPVGNYSVTLPLQVDVGVIPVFPYGKYRIKLSLTKTHERTSIFCIYGFADVVPKKSG